MERWKGIRAAATALLAAVFFGWLAHTVARGPADRFDLAVRDAVHGWASPQLTFAMRGCTLLGSAVVLVPLGAFLAWHLTRAGRRQAAVLLVVAALGGEALDQALKLLFERPRPQAFFGLAQPETYSFPSGHSMASCCFYGVLAMLAAERVRSRARRWAIWAGAAALIACIGFSRIYLGVHYPSDVLGGYLAAVAWLALLHSVIPLPEPPP
jgi:membrane-associated phospholipid phosphatase